MVDDEPSEDANFGGHLEFSSYIEDAKVGDKIEINGKTGRTETIFFNTLSIPYYHDPTFGSVSVDLILKEAGLRRRVPEPFMPREISFFKGRKVTTTIKRVEELRASGKRLLTHILHDKGPGESVSHEVRILLEESAPWLKHRLLMPLTDQEQREEHAAKDTSDSGRALATTNTTGSTRASGRYVFFRWSRILFCAGRSVSACVHACRCLVP